ncbi:hypothetical protein Cob_v002740 [Colletotrichum orbiculare MAFF 240422]|uniref:Uncharacterized protein n=1 Tax=Colletotrichum orbiculare (strain 104-T / ATCC 96160 / CBS 514.97 / LARS 414 / MAFF 240422) TaxID=1213857 RepID=A0A484G2B9_COLOR|nr:hypothetical protein Cob_v002740 [Colletotrichum orbiculare MAFF 240422]
MAAGGSPSTRNWRLARNSSRGASEPREVGFLQYLLLPLDSATAAFPPDSPVCNHGSKSCAPKPRQQTPTGTRLLVHAYRQSSTPQLH